MSLLFTDGFDHYATADILKKWTSHTFTSAGVSINSGGGRRSTNSLRIVGSASGPDAVKTFANSSTIVIGMAISQSSFSASNNIIRLKDGASTQVAFRFNTSGAVEAYRGATLIGTSANGLISTGSFFYFEAKVVFSNTGSVEVRLNGSAIPALNLTSVDTTNTANNYCNGLGISGEFNGPTIDVDDLYVCDTAGSVNNDFLGDVRVDAILPTAEGNYSQFTPSTGTDNAVLVDEATPNASDYVESSTAGHKDSYVMGNLSALVSPDIKAVQVLACAKKDDAGARSLKIGVRSGSTDSVDSGTALSTSDIYYRRVLETDPNTSAAWTESGVNAAEALQEVL